jgi:MinD-like ATPase involved in chromosome partitioning or flagellar assembly
MDTMTQRHRGTSDDEVSAPPPPADLADGVATASCPLPLRAPGDTDEPRPAGQHPWGDPPPATDTGAVSGAPDSGNESPYQWPDQPGAPQVGASEETTEVVDRAKVPAADWMRGRREARAATVQAGPDWRPPGEPLGPGSDPQRPAPAWQPDQPQQPAGAWPADSRGFSHAQGSAANWNYVDSIRSSELVPTRRIPPGRGWRKAVYTVSFKLINLGRSPDERYQAELETKIRSLLRGKYKIGVLGKGGVGKSTIAAAVGSVFAELRQDDRVVAIDADTAFGKLANRIDPAASGSYWELAADRHLFSFGDIRSRVGSNKAGLFVLAGEAATARRRVLDAAIYREATIQLDRHFTLSIVDCGSTLDSPVTQAVLADVDALIVVSSPWYDGASAAGQTLEWLANNGFTGLLHRTVVVVNDSDGHAAKRDRALLVERFGGRGQKVIEMPFDEHLRPGGVIDVKEELNRVTRRRLMELAAACAEHFAATADRPRGV